MEALTVGLLWIFQKHPEAEILLVQLKILCGWIMSCIVTSFLVANLIFCIISIVLSFKRSVGITFFLLIYSTAIIEMLPWGEGNWKCENFQRSISRNIEKPSNFHIFQELFRVIFAIHRRFILHFTCQYSNESFEELTQ